MTACMLSGLDWWLNTLPTAVLTLFMRWLFVGLWHEIEAQKEREQAERDRTIVPINRRDRR